MMKTAVLLEPLNWSRTAFQIIPFLLCSMRNTSIWLRVEGNWGQCFNRHCRKFNVAFVPFSMNKYSVEDYGQHISEIWISVKPKLVIIPVFWKLCKPKSRMLNEYSLLALKAQHKKYFKTWGIVSRRILDLRYLHWWQGECSSELYRSVISWEPGCFKRPSLPSFGWKSKASKKFVARFR
jgi:hypothetical protein